MAEEGAAGAAEETVQLNVRVSAGISSALDDYVKQYRGLPKGQVVERGLRKVLGLEGAEETPWGGDIAEIRERLDRLEALAADAGAV